MSTDPEARFRGDVVLVTGSVQGIGAAIARLFAQDGAAVVVTGLPAHATQGQAVAEALTEDGGNAVFLEADLSDPTAVEALVDDAVGEFGAIDHVVNNAAVIALETPQDCSLEQWDQLMQVNLRAYWLVAKAALEQMDEGTITNVSSIHATTTTPASFPYNVSKAGVAGLTRSLAVDVGPSVRVNSVEPGQVAVERNASVIETQSDDITDAYPLNRLGTASDVAEVVTFLASDAAAFVTGANVPVDGGLHCVQAAYWRDS